MDGLKSLIGKTISSVIPVHDYIQFHFDEGTILTVFNPVTAHECGRETTISRCTGRKVVTIEESTDTSRRMELGFENSIAVIVDLREESYRSPEAMVLTQAGSPTIVW